MTTTTTRKAVKAAAASAPAQTAKPTPVETPASQHARLVLDLKHIEEFLNHVVIGANNLDQGSWDVLNVASDLVSDLCEEFSIAQPTRGTARRVYGDVRTVASLLWGVKLLLQDADENEVSDPENSFTLSILSDKMPLINSVYFELEDAGGAWPEDEAPVGAATVEQTTAKPEAMGVAEDPDERHHNVLETVATLANAVCESLNDLNGSATPKMGGTLYLASRAVAQMGALVDELIDFQVRGSASEWLA